MAVMRPVWHKSELLLLAVPLCFVAIAYLSSKDTEVSHPIIVGQTQWRQRGRAMTMAFSPDGRTLATGSNDGYLHFWNTATGAPQARVRVPIGGPSSIDFSDDGKLVAIAIEGTHELYVWDRQLLTIRHAIRDEMNRPVAIAFSPNGKRLTVAGSRQGVLWDMETGRRMRDLPAGVAPPARSMSDPQPDRPAQPVRIMLAPPLRHSRPQTPASSTGRLTRESREIAFSPDGGMIAGIDLSTGTIILRSGRDGSALYRLAAPNGQDLSLDSLAFSPDGKLLAAQSVDPEADGSHYAVHFWDVKTRKPVAERYLNESLIHCFAFSPTGHLLATGDNEGDITIWERATGQPLQTMKMKGYIYTLAFSPDGRALASSSFGGEIWLTEIAQS